MLSHQPCPFCARIHDLQGVGQRATSSLAANMQKGLAACSLDKLGGSTHLLSAVSLVYSPPPRVGHLGLWEQIRLSWLHSKILLPTLRCCLSTRIGNALQKLWSLKIALHPAIELHRA